MLCPKCGTEVGESLKLCDSCEQEKLALESLETERKTKQENEENKESDQSSDNSHSEQIENQHEEPRLVNGRNILAIIAGMIFLSLLIFYFTSVKSDPQSEVAESLRLVDDAMKGNKTSEPVPPEKEKVYQYDY